MYTDKVSCDSLVVVTRLQVLFGEEQICYRRTACWAILMKSELHLKFCYSCRERVQRLHSRCLPSGTISRYHNSWFSSDVTKIQTPKSQELLRFYLHLAKDLFKRNFCASFQLGMNGVFRFENIAFFNFQVSFRELQQRRRRWQRGRQKSNRFIMQNNNFARASRFFVHFFTVLARLRRENA